MSKDDDEKDLIHAIISLMLLVMFLIPIFLQLGLK